MTTYAYLRTSTEEQLNGIDAQRTQIRAECPDATEVKEHASAKDVDGRPVFTDLLAKLRPGDVVVVSDVDRVSRSLYDFTRLVVRAEEEGWSLKVIGLVDMRTPEGAFVANVLASVADLERRLISQRTVRAMAAARANGKHMGRSGPAIDAKLLAELKALRNGHRVPFGDVATWLNENHRPYPAGGDWTWQRVRSVMVQHGLHVPEARPR